MVNSPASVLSKAVHQTFCGGSHSGFTVEHEVPDGGRFTSAFNWNMIVHKGEGDAEEKSS